MCVSTGSGAFMSAHTMGVQVSSNRHLLGYQIDAASHSGPNCMILHLPATDISSVRAFNTDGAPDLLKNIAKLVAKRISPMAKGGSRSSSGMYGGGYRVIDCGIFTLVIAENAASAMQALREVPLNKRPRHVSRQLLDSYAHNYPDYKLLMACFDNRELGPGQPLLFGYEPLDPTRVFAPGLDEHSGNPPVLGRLMERNFRVIFGSALPEAQGIDLAPVLRDCESAHARHALRGVKARGFHIDEMGPNGDFSLPVSRLLQPYDDTVQHARSLYTASANLAA